jgi:probable UDP-sugar transporter A4
MVSQTTMTTMFIRPLGLPMVFIYCMLSGLAGVYNEWILKKYYTESLHLQNIYLYTYGSLLNFVPAVAIPLLFTRSFRQLNLFEGFSMYTWFLIATQALNGLFMSAVIKHASNIIRLFVISFSLIVTTVLSVGIFHLTLNIYFFISFAAMMCALWLYYFN